ncbi:helix-turn-helix transcriptional regulator [Daejeonella lutea]|uniref:Regulatory protein, luxR family n=1 Tax=Daejeonella lutea TaxID=572036 RepID=A0A1T5AT62_9SPHI|nr:helix-turn-helix transcriptional regulator [Daejeonella lutea]SKB37763.1 regulatory protein, luxR family [Daejeonella lutea]
MKTYTGRASLDEQIGIIAAGSALLPGAVIVHSIKDWTVTWMSDYGLKGLQISLKEVTSLSAEEYYSRFFNEEDSKDYVPKILGLLERNNDDEIVTYFQQVRISGKIGWTWHMSSSRIFMRDEHGEPLYTVTISFPIDAMHHMTSKAARVLEENNFLRQNFQKYSRLSARECEVLKELALGKSSGETAAELFISLSTVETHRKNIRKKLETNSYYELCQYARSFDLI